jgi:endonuclease-3
LSKRLGLTRRDDPEKIAADLEKLIPKQEWIEFSLRMILHGRRVCKARKPGCEICVLDPVCPRIGV